jgi:hypothetical protein
MRCRQFAGLSTFPAGVVNSSPSGPGRVGAQVGAQRGGHCDRQRDDPARGTGLRRGEQRM